VGLRYVAIETISGGTGTSANGWIVPPSPAISTASGPTQVSPGRIRRTSTAVSTLPASASGIQYSV
jgi:hypothetical protein